ncbi:MAG: type VII secretion protein EccE [Pseudonocardia sp.]|nr:type VII secretion protein EccE [Pseudonocardia sp.]
MHVGQIVVWQASTAGVLAAVGRSDRILITVSVIAGLLLLFTVVRFRHRWLYEWVATRIRYTARRHTPPRRRRGDPTGVLTLLAPDASVGTVEVDGVPVGVLEDASGMTVLLEPVGAGTGLVEEDAVTLPPPNAVLPPTSGPGPAVTGQLILHTVPRAPVVAGHAASSYAQLLHGGAPASRRAWFAVRMTRVPGEYSSDDLRRLLGSAVRRLRRRLRAEGTEMRILDADELIPLLGTLAHLDDEPGRGAVRETWTAWRSPVLQASFRLHRWPDLATHEGRRFLDRLTSVPSLSTTLAITTRAGGRRADRGDAEVSTVIRLAGSDPAQLKGAAEVLSKAARESGARLDRLNGDHRSGLAASLPLAGFPR